MTRSVLPCLIFLISPVSLFAQSKTLPPSRVPKAEQETCLKLHNEERKAVGNPPLKWDAKLAAHAQAYADQLAASGEFVHMSREDRRRLDQGENLFRTSRSTPAGQALRAVKSWASEKIHSKTKKLIVLPKGVLYREIKKGYTDVVIGHWTQIIWKSTTQVGIGIAKIQKGKRKGGYVVVARYFRRGNRGSQAPR